MLNSYPEGSEHEYLAWLVSDRYQTDRAAIECICEKARDELLLLNFDEADRLLAEFDRCRKEILERRWQSEEIIYHLSLDSRLRSEGLTLPDVWERVDTLVDEKFEPLEAKLKGAIADE